MVQFFKKKKMKKRGLLKTFIEGNSSTKYVSFFLRQNKQKESIT